MPRTLRIILIVLAILPLSGIAWSQETEPTPKARAHFQAGLSYIDDPEGPRYEEAYREFKAAYAESPHWKILGNLGTCAFYLERDGEAIEAYEGFLARGGDRTPEDQRKQVEKDLATLKTSVARLRLLIEPDSATITDQRIAAKGSPIVNSYTVDETRPTLGIHPGNHRITVSAPGYKPEVWEFEARPGERQAREIRLQREVTATPKSVEPTVVPSQPAPSPVEPKPTRMTHVYVAAAGTATLLVGASVTGVLALSKKSDYDTANGVTRDDATSLRRQTIRLGVLTDVLLGASVLSAAGTAYLYFSSDEGSEGPRDRAVDFQGGLAPNGGWLGVSSRF
jgi:hypothetical protein